MGTFEGKVALVMGASTPGGMGDATARRLRREGARVVVSGFGEQPLQELAQEINGLAFESDITSKQANADLVNFTLENYGQIDLAVNHVGLATHELQRGGERVSRNLLKLDRPGALLHRGVGHDGIEVRRFGRDNVAVGHEAPTFDRELHVTEDLAPPHICEGFTEAVG